MKKNLVRKILPVSYATWTAPAGVTEVIVTVLDKLDNLVTAGGASSYYLRRTGATLSTGFNTSGELGDGTIVAKSSVIPVLGGHSFVQIRGGNSGAIALKADGSAWSWGNNLDGQIGDGTIANKSVPTAVIGSHSFIKVAASNMSGNSAFTALKSNGQAWTWGNNVNGQLGDGTVVKKSSPIAVIGGQSFVDISVSQNGSLALKQTGEVFGWGVNNLGQLGDGTTISKSSPVATVGGHSFISIASGATHSVALKQDGSVWCWGSNTIGQLGNNLSDLTGLENRSSPIAVIGGHSFIKISAGSAFSVALKENGQAWAWGANTLGQLGDTTIISKSSPIQVIGGHSFISIAAGLDFVVALKSNGQAWAWGQNNLGQLGDNTIVAKSSPVQQAGVNLFEAGVQYANRRIFTVTPGTTYNINGFFTAIGAQVMLSTAQNDCYIVLEYYG